MLRTADQAGAEPPANADCTLIVPADPLSAPGLATPYQLTATDAAAGPCHEANAEQSAFVEAAILTGDGQLTLYDPLVVDKGTRPAAPTAPAQVPDGSTVGLWFGFNGDNLTLKSADGMTSLQQGDCVNGAHKSIFGQFAYCNAMAFFGQANQRVQDGTLKVPPLGVAKDGKPCPTTRDFSVVDQDQSDNVVTHYIATGDGQIAQNNKAGRAALQNPDRRTRTMAPKFADLANGSDNLLLTAFIDPALGCAPWTLPNQSSDGEPSAALPLDELSAMAGQRAPIALLPLNNPMTLNGNRPDADKTNLFRTGVNQGTIGGGGDDGDGATYCRNMFGDPAGIQRVFDDQGIFVGAPSVDPNMATNLFTFLAMRANGSFTELRCGNLLGVRNPVKLTMDGNGTVSDATLTPLGQTPTSPGNSAPATTMTAGS
ncbi:hypothetical protein Atai01_43680 [Amycolatopsis taiwanensis]|uniref:Uncharacterized protein n=1 Tax=Amycolatopsis taiwanensis TaxID=342230 RepID=A0A9W6VHW2_9PSEU|nr:hypothetical protein Atai01_43680 [Amycolatopsis taiwanensis]